MMLVKNNEVLSEPFLLPTNIYFDKIEEYDYENHYTKVSNPQELYVTVLNTTTFKKEKKHILKPYAYFRNYEELIGLFNIDDSGTKDNIDNYENKFISYNSNLKDIVENFIKKMSESENLTISNIRQEVENKAKALWDSANQQVKGGNLDDRPLYWARNKMQTYLKRHPLFKNDLDFEKSIVKKDTELDRIIVLFEEKSRNYTGIDFSKINGNKKVLITGFDPFVLNQFNHPNLIGNIKQSNPSGVIASYFANNFELGVDIQTMIVPVRYTDFDNSQNNEQGQGEGIIEKYIKRHISSVDMIIIVSQYLPSENVIDMFGTSRRGGFNDNLDFTRISGTQALSTPYEWIQTTLPKEFEKVEGIKFNWKYYKKDHAINTFPDKNEKLIDGSGGDYLSNEIFYRVAKIRKENRPNLKTGHFHVEMLQLNGGDLNEEKIKNLVELVKRGLKEAIKTL